MSICILKLYESIGFKQKGNKETIVRQEIDSLAQSISGGEYVDEVHHLREYYHLIHSRRTEAADFQDGLHLCRSRFEVSPAGRAFLYRHAGTSAAFVCSAEDRRGEDGPMAGKPAAAIPHAGKDGETDVWPELPVRA